MRFRITAGLGAALLLLAGADYIACRTLGTRMRDVFTSWSDSLTAQGWTVRHGALQSGGFPFGAVLTVPDLAIDGGRAVVPGGVDWQATRVVLTISLLHPWTLTVQPEGEQTTRLAHTSAITFAADDLEATVPLGRGRPDEIDIRGESLTAGLLQSRHPADVRIGTLALQLHFARAHAARTASTIRFTIRGLELPDNRRWPLGATVTEVSAEAALASPALSGIAPADQARAWHDWGGTVQISRLYLHWGPLSLSADASLGLDDALQPAGRAQVKATGWSAALDALAAGNVIAPGMAQTAKAVLGLMAAPGNPSGSLTVPLKLKNDTLSIGQIPLIRIDPIVWAG